MGRRCTQCRHRFTGCMQAQQNCNRQRPQRMALHPPCLRMGAARRTRTGRVFSRTQASSNAWAGSHLRHHQCCEAVASAAASVAAKANWLPQSGQPTASGASAAASTAALRADTASKWAAAAAAERLRQPRGQRASSSEPATVLNTLLAPTPISRASRRLPEKLAQARAASRRFSTQLHVTKPPLLHIGQGR